MSSLDATTSCQFTSPNTLRQGIPSFAAKQSAASAPAGSCAFLIETLLLRQDNTCAFCGHLLTVEMLPDPTRDGPYL